MSNTVGLQTTLADGTSVGNIKLKGVLNEHAIEIESNEPYDDLQVNVSISRRGVNPPNEGRTYDYGITGGVEFLFTGFAIGEGVDVTMQTTHQMKLNSILELHNHYVLPTDGVGDKIKWQLDVVASGVGGAWAVVAGSPFTKEYTIGADEHITHNLLSIASIPPVNTTVSSIYKCRLTRVAPSADSYAGEIYVDYIDGHYQKDTMGSRTEDVK